MEKEKVFKQLLDCSFKIHSALGPGLLESAYQECLLYELKNAGIHVRKQVPMPLIYKEIALDAGYRIDLLLDESIIVEIKSVDTLCDIHLAQILTYLKLSGCSLGLLVNFNVSHLKDGIRRIVL